MNLQIIAFVFALLGVIGSIVLAWFFWESRKRITVLFGGQGAPTEDLEKNIISRLSRLETKLEVLEPRLELAEEMAKISVQKTGFLRFNPFQDTGGDNSFVLALLDSGNNGVIISSLYTREGMRLYGKKVEKGKSKHALSEEEKKVLEEAITKGIANRV